MLHFPCCIKKDCITIMTQILGHVFYKQWNVNSDTAYHELTLSMLLAIIFWQKIVGLNRTVPWPVYFTSSVGPHKNIKFTGVGKPPLGFAPANYIRAFNGINIGSNVVIAQGVVIVGANHNTSDFSKITKDNPIEIGNNVWIGANSVILPNSKIGNNVVIGAGSTVHGTIPDNSIAVGTPCKVIKAKEPYTGFAWNGCKYHMEWQTINAIKALIMITHRRILPSPSKE